MANIYSKLSEVQAELKAPKGNYNSFGKYYSRSAEDILEAVKPLLKKQKLLMVLADDVIHIGDHNYIQATVKLIDAESDDLQTIEVTANARESVVLKGMTDAQISGAASSYARKYALGGMFNIDDTKDADSNEHSKTVNDATNKAEATQSAPKQVTKKTEDKRLADAKLDINEMLVAAGYDTVPSKQLFVTGVIGKPMIGSLEEAHLVADAIDIESGEYQS